MVRWMWYSIKVEDLWMNYINLLNSNGNRNIRQKLKKMIYDFKISGKK